MLDEFKRHITKTKIFSKDIKILATVSGGVDSVVLCYLLKALKINFSIAHCNFNLRGKEAIADQKFVEALAKKIGVNFYTTSFETKEYASINGISIQMAARDLRYNWFDELVQKEGFDLIATAHHKNDNVETVLLNLVRGTSHKGLKGISLLSNNRARPLLPFTKNEIINYANSNNIEWREDISNEDDKYKRNLLRNKIIPLLEELNPNFINTFSDNIEKFNVESEVLSAKYKASSMRFLVDDILNSEIPLYKIWNWIEQYAFTYSDAKNIVDSLNSTSAKVFISNTHRLIKDRSELTIVELASTDFEQFEINELGNFKHSALNIKLTKVEKVDFTLGENVAFFNPEKLKFPITIRKWGDGDKFRPLGMRGKKHVSDFLIDEKASVLDKENQLVVISKNEIVWLLGRRISEDYKVLDLNEAIKIEAK